MQLKFALGAMCVLVVCSMRSADGAIAPSEAGRRMRLSFRERSPLSDAEVMRERMQGGERRTTAPDKFMTRHWDYEIERYSFDVVVPPMYKADVPHGLFVWMGVSEFSPQWLEVLARRKLIFVTPIQIERNYVPSGLWLDAVHNMKQRYAIDEDRVYAGGFSNGAQYAGGMLMNYPEVFRGCLCLMGGNFYIPWKNELTAGGPKWWGDLDEIKKRVTIVMIRGETDQFTPAEGLVQFNGFVLDGFERVAMFVVPRVGHQNPNTTWFEKGVDALDHCPVGKPPTTSPSKAARPEPGQVLQARRHLASAKMWEDAARREQWIMVQVKDHLRRILDDYPTTPAAAEAKRMLRSLDATTRPVQRGNR
jgi:hypothetical protein